MFDVVIAGGGPAGLSAALVLGRCRRQVLLCDEGRPRNARSHAVHNFLTREGMPPDELLRLGREQLQGLDVQVRDVAVVDARPAPHGFDVELADGTVHPARKLLLATGVRDACPEVPDVKRFEGRGVYFCAYCDAFSVRDRPLVALGEGRHAAELAVALTTWSRDVTLCTHGGRKPSVRVIESLNRYGIRVRGERIVGLDGEAHLTGLRMARGQPVPCEGLFVAAGCRPQSNLAERIGCGFLRSGAVRTSRGQRTSVPCVFVAGDAASTPYAVAVAAASGLTAAHAINQELREEDFPIPPPRDEP